jgi:hypothetical protein
MAARFSDKVAFLSAFSFGCYFDSPSMQRKGVLSTSQQLHAANAEVLRLQEVLNKERAAVAQKHIAPPTNLVSRTPFAPCILHSLYAKRSGTRQSPVAAPQPAAPGLRHHRRVCRCCSSLPLHTVAKQFTFLQYFGLLPLARSTAADRRPCLTSSPLATLPPSPNGRDVHRWMSRSRDRGGREGGGWGEGRGRGEGEGGGKRGGGRGTAAQQCEPTRCSAGVCKQTRAVGCSARRSRQRPR